MKKSATGRFHTDKVKSLISSKLGTPVNLYEIKPNKEFNLIATFSFYIKAAAFLHISKTTVKNTLRCLI